jgi:isoquinoline 1-oxidoreductase alpha subunit
MFWRVAMTYRITINGKPHEIDAPGEVPLLWALRGELGLVGTKYGCGIGACGACTVHLDGEAARSCQVPLSSVGDARVTTIEALGETKIGARLQKAWLDHDVMQCGYCQAGQLMNASALLAKTPKPSATEIDSAMEGNLCRCACYGRIRTAIAEAATGGDKSNG